MTASVIQSSFTAGSFGSTFSIPCAAVGTGNSLIAIVDGSSQSIITHDGVADWTTTDQLVEQTMFIRVPNITDGRTSFNFTLAANQVPLVWLYEVSGLDNASPLDQTSRTLAASSTTFSASVTTLAAHEFGLVLLQQAAITGVSAGWTALAGTSTYNGSTAFSSLDLGVAGAAPISGTVGTAGSNALLYATYKLASAIPDSSQSLLLLV